ncbi:MAG TPA: phosphate acyltransferase PlsX [Bacteroidota bacterium]|nr:phosphate acyltransferase PlsX [Bacteroidota bacterium]
MSFKENDITIVADAMGGDYAPGVVVQGALEAVRESGSGLSVILVGRQQAIESELQKHAPHGAEAVIAGRLRIAHADEVIEMHDAPNAALKTKKNSSIAVGLALHRDRKADAFVSAGNTGAVLSASTLILGRIRGIGRPTIGALFPTARHTPCLLLDAGANVDCRARHLYEFGLMGSAYVDAMFGKRRPAVGLLSIGEEEVKGNEVTLEAFRLLKEGPLNFVGNVEGRDLLKGDLDVVVCDGFVGNIILKFGESIPSFLKAKFLRYAQRGPREKLIALMARGGLRSVMKEMDYQEAGGVPLLGVNGVSIIGHGGSTPKAIKNMIFLAEKTVVQNVNGKIQDSLHSSRHGEE